MMTKWLSALVALLILTMPMAATAETAGLTITDPVVTVQGMTLDFTGLKIESRGRLDEGDPDYGRQIVHGRMLVKDEEALRGFVQLGDRGAAVFLDGMDAKLAFDYDDPAVANSLGRAHPISSMETISYEDVLAAILTDGGQVETEYDGQTVTAHLTKITANEAQIKDMLISNLQSAFAYSELFVNVGGLREALPPMNIDVNIYTLDEDFGFIKGTVNAQITLGGGAKVDLKVDLSGEIRWIEAEKRLEIALDADLVREELNGVPRAHLLISATERDAFPGAVGLDVGLELTDAEGRDFDSGTFTLTPVEAAEGFHYNFDLSRYAPGQLDPTMQFGGKVKNADGEVEISLHVAPAPDGQMQIFSLTGKVDAGGALAADCAVSLPQQGIKATFGLNTWAGDTDENWLVEDMNKPMAEYASLSAKEKDALANLAYSALVRANDMLMQLPGYTALAGLPVFN